MNRRKWEDVLSEIHENIFRLTFNKLSRYASENISNRLHQQTLGLNWNREKEIVCNQGHQQKAKRNRTKQKLMEAK